MPKRLARSLIASSVAMGVLLVSPANAYSDSTPPTTSSDFVNKFLASKDPHDPEVQYQVATLYSGATNIIPQDYVQQAKWLLKAAKQGHVKAQAALGEMYAEGHGVRENHAEAAKWYRKAAEQGSGLGELGLALELTTGVGVARDETQAVSWLRKAAQTDSPEGVSRAAQGFLGAAYYFGRGVPQSYGEALTWLRKAGAQGDAAAQVLLGEAYFKGRGVAQDTASGLSWYRKSAEQGNSSGQRVLAYVYAGGLGVPRDSIEAYKWIILATLHADNAEQRGDLATESERFARGMTATQLAAARQRSDQWEQDFRRAHQRR